MGLQLYIGNVININDSEDGERIKVRIKPVDDKTPNDKIPWAFPLLPKMMHIKPKINECVVVLCDENAPKGQRFYIGPIISQPQFIYNENYVSATGLLSGGIKGKGDTISKQSEAIGSLPNSEEIAIIGRKDSDIILSDEDIRIRCGVHLNDKKGKVKFNEKGKPAFIKLKYENSGDTTSTATIVADNINLISHSGSPNFKLNDKQESISDSELSKIIETAHQLPYGDILVHFLSLFLRMFESHTHKYPNDKPCPDTMSKIFYHEYSSNEAELKDKLLSDNVRIN